MRPVIDWISVIFSRLMRATSSLSRMIWAGSVASVPLAWLSVGAARRVILYSEFIVSPWRLGRNGSLRGTGRRLQEKRCRKSA